MFFDVTVIISTKKSDRVYAEIIKMEAAGAAVIKISMDKQMLPLKDFISFITSKKNLTSFL